MNECSSILIYRYWCIKHLTQTSANNHLRQRRNFLSFTYKSKHGDNNSWRKPRGIRNFWLVGLDDLFPLLLCAQPRGWRAALFIFPVFAAWYFTVLLVAPHLWCHSPPRVSSTFISVQSFLLRGWHTNHEDNSWRDNCLVLSTVPHVLYCGIS